MDISFGCKYFYLLQAVNIQPTDKTYLQTGCNYETEK